MSSSPGRTAAPGADVLLVGVAIRPCAQSARRAGYDVISVDPFGDRDHRDDVKNRSLKRDAARGLDALNGTAGGLAPALVDLSERVRGAEVAYGSSFENHPDLVERLGRSGRLLGNPPDVLGAVRDPARLFGALREGGFDVPRSSATGEAATLPPASRWLRKPARGGGGRGVRPWRGEPLSDSEYLQEEIPGRPGSILFVASRGEIRLLGLTEMLVGWPDFGAPRYAYCGSVLAPGPELFPGVRSEVDAADDLEGTAVRLARFVAETFDLRGVCGIDFVTDGGTLWPLEVNPRYTAAMELLEGTLPAPVFELHRSACEGRLPVLRPGRPRPIRAKAVLRARAEHRAPDLVRAVEGLPGIRVADLPDRGERIRAGAPLCTLITSGGTRCDCLHALRRAARRIYAAMGTSAPPR